MATAREGSTNLILGCPMPAEPDLGLCWILPAGSPPPAFNTALSPAHLDAGPIRVPDPLIDGTFTGGTIQLRFCETSKVTMELARGPQRRHLVVDLFDAVARVRWQLNNANLRPGPNPFLGPWPDGQDRVLCVDATVQPADVAVVKEAPVLR